MRTFEFVEGTSSKFWNITLTGKSFTVNFGKIGTTGQTQIKDFADEAAAKKEHDKLVAEKVKKGYRETTPAGSAAPAATAPTPAAPAATAAAPAKPAKSKAKQPEPPAAPAPAPAAAFAAPAPPAPAASAAAARTFEYSDATSHKFWNIEKSGTSFTVTYGRIGSAGQTQTKTFADEAATQKEYDKQVAEKVKKGYRETSPSAKVPSSLRESLEMAVAENPDDLASHMAYADYLTEQGDPKGDFVRVQLALEDSTKPEAERKKLQQQEKALLDQHARTWLGDLAPFCLDEQPEDESTGYTLKAEYTFRRGWLDSIKVDYPNVGFARALANSPQVRLLRHLEMPQTRYEDQYEPEPGDGVPEGCYRPTLYLLARSANLGNVRVLSVGERMSQQEDDQYMEYGPSCHSGGEGAAAAVKAMPRLEELYLLAHRTETKELFALKSLHNLRILQVYHCHDFPLASLAKNPSLGNLTHLLCWPHALEFDEEPYIRTPAVKAIVTSPILKSLTHLRLRCSDTANAGIQEIIKSGILKRLKVLDMRHGRVTDEGAHALAACPDAKNLELLDLCNNAMTTDGIKALQTAGIKVRAEYQWQITSTMGRDEEMYLFCGDVE